MDPRGGEERIVRDGVEGNLDCGLGQIRGLEGKSVSASPGKSVSASSGLGGVQMQMLDDV